MSLHKGEVVGGSRLHGLKHWCFRVDTVFRTMDGNGNDYGYGYGCSYEFASYDLVYSITPDELLLLMFPFN